MNDDLVQPKRGHLKSISRNLIISYSGFGEHPHRDAEICTYVVDGYLTHEDSMGTNETLERGDIQFMVLFPSLFHHST